MKKIALVTGGNRGIGFETCRQLAEFGMHVLLTSRNPSDGEKAAARLIDEGLDVSYHQLDVTNTDQIDTISDYLYKEFGRLDVLVNNAGVLIDESMNVLEVPISAVEVTLDVNLYGPLHTTQAFIPLMKENNFGRVVNVSSTGGSLEAMGTKPGNIPSYRISKAALNALTRLTAGAVKGYDIKVNSMCPGWVRTDMGGSNAPRSPSQGVETIIWLATLPKSGPHGGFFKDKKRIPW
jgi:NAD(P)-dependent dehydrogenase (short-subunit alcohol dehydrogenase family)